MHHHAKALSWLTALAASLAALAAAVAIAPATAQALDPVTGERTALVIVVGWGELPGMPASTPKLTPGELVDVMNNVTTPWYESVSRHQFHGWRTDGAGPYTIDPRDPRDSRACTEFDPDYAIRQAAMAAAAADGFAVDSYDNVVIYNENPCNWASRGSLSGRTVHLRHWYSVDRDTIHELGHNLGLNHSGALWCRDGNGRQVTLGDDCSTVAYGDPYSAMAVTMGSFAASQQWALGWMTQRKLDLTIGDHPARLVLQPLESVGLTVQALRVEDTDATYWVEYRASLGVDATPPGYHELTGVLVRREAPGDPSRSILLDLFLRPGYEFDFVDADLPVGQSWANPKGTLRYTVNSIGPLGADITIEKKFAPVPDVIGMTRAAASSALAAAGYLVGLTRTAVDSTCNNVGTVMNQTPGAGRRLPPGTAVAITTGTRPAGGCP